MAPTTAASSASPLPVPERADFACVPIRGFTGKIIHGAEYLAMLSTAFTGGVTLREVARYQHAFGFLGKIDDPRYRQPGTSLSKDLSKYGWTQPGYYCVQAEPKGSELGWLGRDLEEASALWGDQALWSTGCFPMTQAQRTRIVRAWIMSLGTPYSFLDYGSLFLHHLHIRLPFVEDYVADTGHMICSQLVDWGYQQGGVQIFSDQRFNGDVMPSDLAFRTIELQLAA